MLHFLWRRFVADRLVASLLARMAPELNSRISAAVVAQLGAMPTKHLASDWSQRLEPELDARIEAAIAVQCALIRSEMIETVQSKLSAATPQKPWKANLFIPSIELHARVEEPFMGYSTCSASDFLHPEFRRLSKVLGLPLTFHRKYWEWVFILHHGLRTGAIGPGKRALGFAVGAEPLPAAFARLGTKVLATDAPTEIGVAKGWQKGGQHAALLEDLYHADIVDRSTFDNMVTFLPCDMTRIPQDFTDYDFCWSSCSFEHLGTLATGIDFVVESLEKTLSPGGVACHTTEFNLSSDQDTIEEGPTVLYRRQDILRLIDLLEQRGHAVEPFSIAPDTHILDGFVDTPPYEAPPHLKLQLLGYVSTSVGLVIRRKA